MKLLLGIVGESKQSQVVPDDVARQALQSMPTEEAIDFSALKERLEKKMLEEKFKTEVKRQVGDRAAMEHSTPDCIKALRPEWKGCGICLDYGKKAFEAYYPAGKPTKSVAMTFDSVRAGDESANPSSSSKLAALTYCVEFLWNNHSAKGRATSLEFVDLGGRCLRKSGLVLPSIPVRVIVFYDDIFNNQNMFWMISVDTIIIIPTLHYSLTTIKLTSTSMKITQKTAGFFLDWDNLQ